MDLIGQLERENGKKNLPTVHIGDTVEVNYLIKEGDKERIQLFIGTVIALYLFKSVASVAFVSIATFLSGLLLGFRMMKPYAAVSLPTTIRVGWQQGSYLLNRVRHEFAR